MASDDPTVFDAIRRRLQPQRRVLDPWELPRIVDLVPDQEDASIEVEIRPYLGSPGSRPSMSLCPVGPAVLQLLEPMNAIARFAAARVAFEMFTPLVEQLEDLKRWPVLTRAFRNILVDRVWGDDLLAPGGKPGNLDLHGTAESDVLRLRQACRSLAGLVPSVPTKVDLVLWASATSVVEALNWWASQRFELTPWPELPEYHWPPGPEGESALRRVITRWWQRVQERVALADVFAERTNSPADAGAP